MPFVEMRILAGRSPDVVEECMREVARTVARTLGAPLGSVRVVVHEIQPNRWAIGDVLKSESDD